MSWPSSLVSLPLSSALSSLASPLPRALCTPLPQPGSLSVFVHRLALLLQLLLCPIPAASSTNTNSNYNYFTCSFELTDSWEFFQFWDFSVWSILYYEINNFRNWGAHECPCRVDVRHLILVSISILGFQKPCHSQYPWGGEGKWSYPHFMASSQNPLHESLWIW